MFGAVGDLALLLLPIPLKNKKRAKANVPNVCRQKKFLKMRREGFILFFLSVGDKIVYGANVHRFFPFLYVVCLQKASNFCVNVHEEPSVFKHWL